MSHEAQPHEDHPHAKADPGESHVEADKDLTAMFHVKQLAAQDDQLRAGGDINAGGTDTGSSGTGDIDAEETEAAEREDPSQSTESSTMYERLKSKATGVPFTSRRKGGRRRRDIDAPGEAPFTPGRDPRGLGSVLDNLTVDLGWTSTLAKSELLVSWAEVVGDDIAARTQPIAIEEHTLTVSCESTAWATQLRLMSSDILTKIVQRFPEADVTSIRFQGPNAPSWKRGPRSIPGRGPRDTYG